MADYGLYIITSVVLIGAMGIPMPSSAVALTSGGLWQQPVILYLHK